ncbi:MAG: LTA synthase family protein [Leptospiraceae bacterium]|nr:LTA synthase family protein [Leptospiraceae bacterium]
MLNQFVLNGVFTTLIDFRVEKFPQIQNMNEVEAIAITREVIANSESSFAHDAFPIFRKIQGKKDYGKPNILLIILESWPAKYSNENFSAFIEGKEITPNFNTIKKEGLYFPRFFANGGRTSNGLVAILTGFPDRPGVSLIHTKYALNRFTPLGVLLKNAGYKTSFYYGGQLAFENIAPILKNWGFDDLYDYEFFEKLGNFQKGVWGYNDLDVYKQILEHIKNSKEDSPQLIVCLTLSTHHPFQIPSKEFEIFAPTDDENKFLNSLHYSDFALGEFLRSFKQLKFSENTIVFIVSDHTSHRKLNYYEDRNIPFLIYSPRWIAPNVNNKIGSQVDILPTILSLIDHEFYFSSIGNNLLSQKEGFAYIAFGNIYGIAEKNIMFLDTVDSFNGLNFSMSPPFLARKSCKEEPTPCLLPHKKAKAILNTTEFLLKKNLIAPPLE